MDMDMNHGCGALDSTSATYGRDGDTLVRKELLYNHTTIYLYLYLYTIDTYIFIIDMDIYLGCSAFDSTSATKGRDGHALAGEKLLQSYNIYIYPYLYLYIYH